MRSVALIVLLSTAVSAQNIWVQMGTPTSPAPTYIHDIAVLPNGHIFIADGQGTGIWKSTDGGSTWSQVNSGLVGGCTGHPNGNLCAWSVSYDSFHSQLLVGLCVNCDHTASKNASFWRSSNEGASWTSIPIPASINNGITNQPAITGPAINPITGFAVWGGHWDSTGLNGTFWSTDGFATTNAGTFTAVACSSPAQGAYGFLFNPKDNSYWLGGEDCGLYRSTDGKAWTEVSPALCGFGTPCFSVWGDQTWNSYDASGNIITMADGGGGVYRGTPGSGGQWNWTKLGGGTFQDGGLVRDPSGNFYTGQAPSSGDNVSAVFRSTDQGATWSPWTTGIPLNACGKNQGATHIVYSGFDQHLYAVVYYGGCSSPTNIYGFIYKTVQPISGGGGNPPPPPTNLAVVVR